MTIKRSEKTDKLFAALYKAKASIAAPRKNSKNPAFKSRYADLSSVIEAVEGPAHEAGLFIVQSPISEDDYAGAETYLMHESGQHISTSLTFQIQRSGPQGAGSCITYARRYALMSLFALAADDDDDGNAGQRASKAAAQKPTKRTAGERKTAAAMKFLEAELFGPLRSVQAEKDIALIHNAISDKLNSTMATTKGEEKVGKRVVAAINAVHTMLDDNSHHTSDQVPLRNALLDSEDLDESNSMAWIALVRSVGAMS